MNLSRAYTLTYGDELCVGRVQTPTLAMVVERELAMRQLRAGRLSGSHSDVSARGAASDKSAAEAYKGTWVRDVEEIQKSLRGCPPDGVEADQIVGAGARPGTAAIESVKAETQRMGRRCCTT